MRFLRGHAIKLSKAVENRIASNKIRSIENNLEAAYAVNPTTGCWEWKRSVGANGYGQLQAKGKNVLAHRHFYEIFKGPIPEGKHIDHLCRNCTCVNPAHLEPVTPAENVRRGKLAKLSPEQVFKIRNLYDGGGLISNIAAQFGVSPTCVSDIVNQRRWR